MLPSFEKKNKRRSVCDQSHSNYQRRGIIAALLTFIASVFLLTGSLDDYVPNDSSLELSRRHLSQKDNDPLEQDRGSLNSASIIAMQFDADKYASSDKLQLVLDGTLQLIDCTIAPDAFEAGDNDDNNYKNIQCSFCDIGAGIWKAQKENPSLYPHFGNILGESEHCNNHRYSFPLVDLVAATKSYQDTTTSAPTRFIHTMECGAFIFHQGKSGSSAFMNAINIADPEGIVIAEHPALESVINACEKAESFYDQKDCQLEKQVKAMQDIVGLISRTSDDQKKKVYFKLHPSTSGNTDVAATAFPQCKRIFIYRDPNTLLTKHTLKKKRSSCVKMKNHPNQLLQTYINEKGMHMKDMTDEMVCSAYLASLLRSATLQHEKSPPNTSIIINYDDYINNENSKALMDVLSEYLGIETAKDPQIQTQILNELKKKASGRNAGDPWNGENLVTFSKEVLDANQMFLQKEIPTVR